MAIIQEADKKRVEAHYAKSPKEESAIAKKATATRRRENPAAFIKMDKKGDKSRGDHSST